MTREPNLFRGKDLLGLFLPGAARRPAWRRGGIHPARALAQRVAPVARRLARAGHQLPVDDRVRLAPALDVGRKSADRRVDSVGGSLLRVEVADRALLVRVGVARLPPSLALVPVHPPELGRRRSRRGPIESTWYSHRFRASGELYADSETRKWAWSSPATRVPWLKQNWLGKTRHIV